jgi:hypothetical protein
MVVASVALTGDERTGYRRPGHLTIDGSRPLALRRLLVTDAARESGAEIRGIPMSSKVRKYLSLPWPQIVFVLVLALIIAVLQEPHPIRYALAGLLVVIAGAGIFFKMMDRRSGETAQDDDRTPQ